MAVSWRILATVVHFELEQNVGFRHKISEILRSWPTPCCSPAPSLQIRSAIWRHESKAPTGKSYGKIPRGQTNSQISRNSRANTPKVEQRFCPRFRQSPRHRCYSSANRSASHMEISGIEEIRCFPDTWVAVPWRILATVTHFELEQNLDF